MSISLSPRLKSAAELVVPGRLTADVGTDHGYLPAFLVLNGISPECIASDVVKGPLENARKTIEKYGLEDKISLRLSDGLKNYEPGEVSEILICGMGGNLISDILSACPWVCSEDVHLVLQPMTHQEDVRKYLCENGFVIKDERLCIDNKRLYVTISAFYTGEKKDVHPGYYYFGELPGKKDELAVRMAKKQYDRVKKKLEGHIAAGEKPEEYKYLSELVSYYENSGDGNDG